MAAEEEKKKPKKANKLIIIIILMSFVLLVGSAITVFLVTDIKISDVLAKFQKHEEYIVQMDSFVVNLNTEGKSNIYLKTQVALLYTNEDHETIINNKTSQIRDVIIKDLMEYKPEELLLEGGLSNVKRKLRTSINDALGQEVVNEIYFTDFLIQ